MKFQPATEKPSKADVRALQFVSTFVFGTLCLVLFVAVAMPSLGAVTDSKISFSNASYNDSGMYVGNAKVTPGGYDNIICYASTLSEYISKFPKCTRVCGYLDADCGDDIISGSEGERTLIMPGNYTVSSYMRLKNNTVIHGSGKGVTNLILNKDIGFYSTGQIQNVEISSLSFVTTFSSSSTAIAFDKPPATNIKVSDVAVINTTFQCLRVTTFTAFSNPHENVKISGFECYNGQTVLGAINGLILRDSIFSGKSSSANTVMDLSFDDGNNAYISNAVISGNTFKNDVSGACIAQSSNLSASFTNNYFNCFSSAFNAGTDSSVYTINLRFFGNEIRAFGNISAAAITGSLRSNKSFVDIVGNHFVSNTTTDNYAILLRNRANIAGNSFDSWGRTCVYAGEMEQTIVGNTFKDCGKNVTTNFWVYLDPGSDFSTVTGNTFISTATVSNTVIRVDSGVQNLSIHDNMFRGINSAFVSFTTAADKNNSYIEPATYAALPTCQQYNVMNGKVIDNSTHLCKCIAGTWKCAALS